MKISEFIPRFFLDLDNGNILHVMLSLSKDYGCEEVYSVEVDSNTGDYVSNVVESSIYSGYNGAPYFHRNKKRYYLSWLKPLMDKN